MKKRVLVLTAGILAGFLLLCCHVSEKKAMTPTNDSFPKAIQHMTLDPVLKTPIYIQYKPSQTANQKLDESDWPTWITGILKADPNIFNLNDPEKEIVVHEIRLDELRHTHVQCGRIHHDIEIWGDRLVFHFNDAGHLTSFQGRYHRTLSDSLPIQPKLDKESILSMIIKDQNLDDQSSETVPCKLIYFISDSVRLAWELDIKQKRALTGTLYIADAETGIILRKDNKIRN
jgi:Zn-dependent metalloprotease